jgi:FixJ family two-component response regulator
MMAVRAMKAGAVEFFTKPCRSDVLLNSLHHAIERSQSFNASRGADTGDSGSLRDAHRGRVMQKMNAASFAELINMAATLLSATKPDRPIVSEWSCHADITTSSRLAIGVTLPFLEIRFQSFPSNKSRFAA